ncbi:hypothetical protein BC835DRAFT_1308940 [Cytidiella melzeri]|nr:hypothetical protein BC835DRAFT_1308940 [Cytidiella melzeri]
MTTICGALTVNHCQSRWEKTPGKGLAAEMGRDYLGRNMTYRISLQQLAQLSSKLKHSIESWDQRRGLWEVVFHHEAKTNTNNLEGDRHEICPITRITRTAHIPTPLLASHPQDKEDWEEEVSALFEWVGMACLGSERLQANDHPDPYIAVYEPPETLKDSSCVPSCAESSTQSQQPMTGHAILQSPVTYSRTTAKQHALLKDVRIFEGVRCGYH